MRSLIVLAGLAVSGCITRPVISTPPAACSTLVPQSWKEGIEGYPIPSGASLSEWQAAFIGQAGRLEMANGRTKDVIGMQERCEALVNSARK